MKLETERLELVVLDEEELYLWMNDLPALECKQNCHYDAEPVIGMFRDIVTGQYEQTHNDPTHTPYHSFFWLIRKSDRTVVGSADFKDVPDENGEIEIGYGLGAVYEKNGYMTEAVRAMCAWAFRESDVRAVIAETEPDGIASQHILARCGFRKYKEDETAWFRLDKDGYMEHQVSFRKAERADVPLILEFIRALATYEKMDSQVVATEDLLTRWLFDEPRAEVIFAVADGTEVGFALFFHNFSTFLGKSGIYLEDLFVKPEYRGRGYGKAILRQLARIAVERECGRLEWWCLDWNQPSIDFYRSLGAVPMDEWTTYRITGKTLTDLANQ